MTKSKKDKATVPNEKGAKVVYLDGKALGEIKYDRKDKTWSATSYFAEMGADCIDNEADAKEYVVDDYWEWINMLASRLGGCIDQLAANPEILDALTAERQVKLIRTVSGRLMQAQPPLVSAKVKVKGGKK